ncbi:MAG TPA: DUF72 domain-containing protein [Candidatus Bathyarchaeia archaeon]|nr:DUF72 domain-containing protein [Candidatus Bathyarchaeia archaeon]
MIRIGTSGYNYPEWRGSFYPEKFPTGEMLPYYAERFSTVEINYTFYRMPNAKTVAGWVAETPADFSFTLKAPQRITHIARLREIGDPLRYFLDTAAGLGGKLGTVLFQLPPNFKKDLARLGGLLDQLPAGLRCAFEFRHETWLSDDVYERLRAGNAALCIADTEEATTPVEPTADWGYLRLRDQGYREADLAEWAETIEGMSDRWRDTFVYFKHEEAGTGPAFARQLEAILRR